jgi:hypothetical protein
MARPRNMGRVVVAVLAITVAPSLARAQAPRANDPDAGSPSGVIYAIPLDAARSDAAPRQGGSTRGLSPIHSENGFGSSSQVPGVEAAATAAAGSGGGPASESPAQRNAGDGAVAGSRARGVPAVGGENAGRTAEAPAERLSQSTGHGSPSSIRAFLLLALGVVVPAGLGVAARRSTR